MKEKFKKIYYLFTLAMMLYVPKVYALSCTKGSGDLVINTGAKTVVVDSAIPATIHTIIVILKVAVPVILVVLGTLDLLKGVTASKEDEIKKGQTMFFKRLIAAVIVFFVITIVQLVISFVDNDNDGIWPCANCFINNKCTGAKDTTKKEEVTWQCTTLFQYNLSSGVTATNLILKYKLSGLDSVGVTRYNSSGESYFEKVTPVIGQDDFKPSFDGECPSTQKYVFSIDGEVNADFTGNTINIIKK